MSVCVSFIPHLKCISNRSMLYTLFTMYIPIQNKHQPRDNSLSPSLSSPILLHSPLFSTFVARTLSIYSLFFIWINTIELYLRHTHSINNSLLTQSKITDTCKLIKFDNNEIKRWRVEWNKKKSSRLHSTNDFIFFIESHELDTTRQVIVWILLAVVIENNDFKTQKVNERIRVVKMKEINVDGKMMRKTHKYHYLNKNEWLIKKRKQEKITILHSRKQRARDRKSVSTSEVIFGMCRFSVWSLLSQHKPNNHKSTSLNSLLAVFLHEKVGWTTRYQIAPIAILKVLIHRDKANQYIIYKIIDVNF